MLNSAPEQYSEAPSFWKRVRKKVKKALLLGSLTSSAINGGGCQEGFSIQLINGRQDLVEPTDHQYETIIKATDILDIDSHFINGKSGENFNRGVMRLTMTKISPGYTLAQTIENTRCLKKAIIYDGESDPTLCPPGEEDCYEYDVVAAAHEIGHLAGLGHTCDCYEDECPNEWGVVPECPVDDPELCQDMLDQGCTLCENLPEGNYKVCTDANNGDLMSGSYTGPRSVNLTKKERRIIRRKLRNFDWCIGGR